MCRPPSPERGVNHAAGSQHEPNIPWENTGSDFPANSLVDISNFFLLPRLTKTPNLKEKST